MGCCISVDHYAKEREILIDSLKGYHIDLEAQHDDRCCQCLRKGRKQLFRGWWDDTKSGKISEIAEKLYSHIGALRIKSDEDEKYEKYHYQQLLNKDDTIRIELADHFPASEIPKDIMDRRKMVIEVIKEILYRTEKLTIPCTRYTHILSTTCTGSEPIFECHSIKRLLSALSLFAEHLSNSNRKNRSYHQPSSKNSQK